MKHWYPLVWSKFLKNAEKPTGIWAWDLHIKHPKPWPFSHCYISWLFAELNLYTISGFLSSIMSDIRNCKIIHRSLSTNKVLECSRTTIKIVSPQGKSKYSPWFLLPTTKKNNSSSFIKICDKVFVLVQHWMQQNKTGISSGYNILLRFFLPATDKNKSNWFTKRRDIYSKTAKL